MFRLLTVPPIALGAWCMALVIWQPAEYYYRFPDFELFLCSYLKCTRFSWFTDIYTAFPRCISFCTHLKTVLCLSSVQRNFIAIFRVFSLIFHINTFYAFIFMFTSSFHSISTFSTFLFHMDTFYALSRAYSNHF